MFCLDPSAELPKNKTQLDPVPSPQTRSSLYKPMNQTISIWWKSNEWWPGTRQSQSPQIIGGPQTTRLRGLFYSIPGITEHVVTGDGHRLSFSDHFQDPELQNCFTITSSFSSKRFVLQKRNKLCSLMDGQSCCYPIECTLVQTPKDQQAAGKSRSEQISSVYKKRGYQSHKLINPFSNKFKTNFKIKRFHSRNLQGHTKKIHLFH